MWLALWLGLLATPSPSPNWLDGGITLGALAAWAGLDSAHAHLVDTSCPCTPDQINRVERPAVHFDVDGAEAAADALTGALMLGAVALPLVLGEDTRRWRDALLVMESMALAGLLTQMAKTTVGRPYPYMNGPAPYVDQNDDGVNYASFWSGHTAVPMAGLVAASQLYGRRAPRSDWGRWLRWLGPALALTAGAFQVAASNHYPSDVIVGGLVGAAVGVGVPAFRAVDP